MGHPSYVDIPKGVDFLIHLRSHYERIDPVILQALRDTELFAGESDRPNDIFAAQKRLLDCLPIWHSLDSLLLSMTTRFPLPPSPLPATNGSQFERFAVESLNASALMAMFFHLTRSQPRAIFVLMEQLCPPASSNV